MNRTLHGRRRGRSTNALWAARCAALAPLVVAPLVAAPAFGQAAPLTAEDAAANLLNAGRRAFNDRNFPVASEKFKAFLAANGGHRDAPWAQYGLGMSLLQLQPIDLPAATEALKQAAGNGGFPERAMATYQLALVTRTAGHRAAAEAAAKPGPEGDPLRAAAGQRYTEAAANFTAAAAAFEERTKADKTPLPAAPAPLPADLEWAALARCGRADMLIRTAKAKEAIDVVVPFGADPVFSRSRYKPLAIYHLASAQFALPDYKLARKALDQLAPYDQEFGPHARYLSARIHHLSDETAEAAAEYKAVLDGHEQQKTAAKQKLTAGGQIPSDVRESLEALANGPAPDYVVRADFYAATLLSDEGHAPEAAARFAALIQQSPKSPLVPEAQLRLGYAKLQAKDYAEAIKSLEPLKDHPLLSDRALWWLARTQVATADPSKADAYGQALQAPIGLLKTAAERAKAQMQGGDKADPDAKVRRVEIILELADAQQRAKAYADAAASYQAIVAEHAETPRMEEVVSRRVTALHLAANYRESDALAEQFEQKYAKSPLLAAVWFRSAENAYLMALTAANDPNAKGNKPEVDRLFYVALQRYYKLVEKYPDYEYIDLSRQAMATVHHRAGRYSDAAALLKAIPEANRVGDLANVSYLLADCDVRMLPAEATGKAQVKEQIAQLTQSAATFEAFIAANPKSPQTPDALYKLGHCHQRLAALQPSADAEKASLALSRAAYDKCSQAYPADPVQPAVAFDRAACLASLGDAEAAATELRRFATDPFRASPNAPLAMVRLSALLRGQGKAAEAAEVMKKCRADYDGALAADPARVAWVPLLQYEQALALKEAKKLPEARAAFEAMATQQAGKPEALNAAWRATQCRREEVADLLALARTNAAKPGAKPEEIVAAYAPTKEPLKALEKAADGLAFLVEVAAKQSPDAAADAASCYELAWCRRTLGEAEADAARVAMRQDLASKLRERMAFELKTPNPPPMPLPDVPASAVPIQPGETAARALYEQAIKASPRSIVASSARIDLAELLTNHGENDAALKLLTGVLENNPPADAADRAKLRITALLLAKNDPKAAFAQARPIAQDPAHPLGPDARYLVAESLLQQQNWADAVAALTPFRDDEKLRAVPGISDRALLRLAFAQAQAGQWEPSRQSAEAVAQRYPQSPWLDEALYAQGWSLQNQKRFDDAVNAYEQLTRRTVSEVAAKAQFNVGLCRLEQKRNADAVKLLQTVAYAYDYPQWSAAAWYEAGQANATAEPPLPAEAAQCWQRVVDDFPTSKWAPLARQKLSDAGATTSSEPLARKEVTP